MCCHFLFILLYFFNFPLSLWKKYVSFPILFLGDHFEKISFHITLRWVHCILFSVRKHWEITPCYTLEKRCIYSIIQGTPLVQSMKKGIFSVILIYHPEGGEKETPCPTPPAALHPWFMRGKLSLTQSSSPALLPGWSGWGAGMRVGASRGERDPAGSQPRAGFSHQHLHQSWGHLLGSTQAVPWCQKQDCAHEVALCVVFSHGEFARISVGMISCFDATVRGRWDMEN